MCSSFKLSLSGKPQLFFAWFIFNNYSTISAPQFPEPDPIFAEQSSRFRRRRFRRGRHRRPTRRRRRPRGRGGDQRSRHGGRVEDECGNPPSRRSRVDSRRARRISASTQAATLSDDVHVVSVGGVGEGLFEDTLPRCFYEVCFHFSIPILFSVNFSNNTYFCTKEFIKLLYKYTFLSRSTLSHIG